MKPVTLLAAFAMLPRDCSLCAYEIKLWRRRNEGEFSLQYVAAALIFACGTRNAQ